MKNGLSKVTQLPTAQFPSDASKRPGKTQSGRKKKHPYLKAGFKFKSKP
jgi:hypothetical protein